MKKPRLGKKRGNGQGSIYKYGNGWAAEMTQGYYLDGDKVKRKIKRKKGFRTKKDAEQWIYTCSPNTDKRTPTVSELWVTFGEMVAPTLSKSKNGAYNIAWDRIRSDTAFRTIDSFTVSELQAITDNAAPSYYTRRDIKTLFSHFYKLAIRDDYVSDNKAQYIKLPKLVQSERETFTTEDIRALWDDYRAQPSTVSAGMLIMLYTGIRPGELLTITSDKIHIDDHYMNGGIKTEKGKRRKIILPDEIIPIINYLLSGSQNNQLCYYKNKNDFYDEWAEKRTRLQLRECLTPYCCRHTYITDLTARGASPAMLQELAGHEDYETTLAYTHLSVDDRLKTVNELYK